MNKRFILLLLSLFAANAGMAAINSTDLGKRLNASFGYLRSFYAQNLPLLQVANENTISAGLSYDLKVFKTTLNNYFHLGSSRMFLCL